jgi:pimeloyl-ACP methyl ester carboxylesterase
MPQPSLLLVHGALTGAWVWDSWRRHLGSLGWQVNVIDLRGHGRSLPTDLSTVTMEDYVADLASVTVQIERAQGVHPIVGGWSMGGLIAMMYAAQHPETPGLLLISPSLPLEAGGKAPIEVVREASGAVLEPEAFGLYADDPGRSAEVLFDLSDEERRELLSRIAGCMESGIASRQVLRGISLASQDVSMPSCVLCGESEPAPRPEQCRTLATYLGGEAIGVPGAGHWGIVCHAAAVEAAAPEVDRWLRRSVGPHPEEGIGNGA